SINRGALYRSSCIEVSVSKSPIATVPNCPRCAMAKLLKTLGWILLGLGLGAGLWSYLAWKRLTALPDWYQAPPAPNATDPRTPNPNATHPNAPNPSSPHTGLLAQRDPTLLHQEAAQLQQTIRKTLVPATSLTPPLGTTSPAAPPLAPALTGPSATSPSAASPSVASPSAVTQTPASQFPLAPSPVTSPPVVQASAPPVPTPPSLTLSSTEVETLLLDRLVTQAGDEGGLSAVLQSAQGFGATITDGTFRGGLVLNTDRISRQSLSSREAEALDRLLATVPGLRGRDLYIGLRGVPTLKNGQLHWQDDLRLEIGNTQLSLPDLAQRLGVDPGKFDQELNKVLGNLPVDSLRLEGDRLILQGAPSPP
ncbi:MAG: hypothetical protein ACO4AJ_08680, partial [Prochlorothrix sp.]